MRTLLIPSNFYDVDEIFKALLDDVSPIIYDFHAPFPVTHKKIMKYFRKNKPTHVGILLARDSAEDKAMKFFSGDVPLLASKPKSWANFGVLAASIQAITGLDRLYVLNKHLDTFEIAGLQKDILTQHDITIINSFDFVRLEHVAPQDLFFNKDFSSYCHFEHVVPKNSLNDAVRDELRLKIRNITGIPKDVEVLVNQSVLSNGNFKAIWQRLKDVMAFKELESDIFDIDCYFAKPEFAGLAKLTRAVLRIMFACKRDVYGKPIGSSNLTFAACIELLLLPVLALDIVLASSFYGYVFGNDNNLKLRILDYIDTEAFTDKLVAQDKLPVIDEESETENPEPVFAETAACPSESEVSDDADINYFDWRNTASIENDSDHPRGHNTSPVDSDSSCDTITTESGISLSTTVQV